MEEEGAASATTGQSQEEAKAHLEQLQEEQELQQKLLEQTDDAKVRVMGGRSKAGGGNVQGRSNDFLKGVGGGGKEERFIYLFIYLLVPLVVCA